MEKNKTNELERIQVEDTQVVSVDNLNLSNDLTENDINQMSVEEINYALEFENHDPLVVSLLKKALKNKK
ncbi:hypothetical protein MGM1_5050 [Candidatus Malacoplasma girerdii]|uniref:Uncharacterized protein n=1 Tax=Candidatus Malacoplasma girerdii TaxID=1318617 RepID=A0A097STE3_9BACT|nr:hypothetical protein MGM1_5050 [Candidatus Malacoplasma girerdii]ASJ89381.1 MAG: hypothetical protein B1217_0504 [Candidatus Malacoplasma girerdii]